MRRSCGDDQELVIGETGVVVAPALQPAVEEIAACVEGAAGHADAERLRYRRAGISAIDGAPTVTGDIAHSGFVERHCGRDRTNHVEGAATQDAHAVGDVTALDRGV